VDFELHVKLDQYDASDSLAFQVIFKDRCDFVEAKVPDQSAS
jgi:hypothetical protein